MLVCPGHSTMTLFPMFPTACIMPPPRPCPNASSNTSETTPQLMPSMVSADRMRLRRNAVQLCCTSSVKYILHLGSLVPQALDGIHICRPLRRIHTGADCDDRQRYQRAHNRNYGNDGLGNEVRQRRHCQQHTDSHTNGIAERAAQNSDSH